MAKPTTISEALQRLEERVQKPATELKVVELQFQWPPIKKMDKTLGTLTACEKLSLSTNMIEKIEALKGLDNLKILSLGRNYIKSLSGLEVLGDTLEQLWISYNLIEKLGAIDGMKALKVLYIGNNLVKDWDQFQNLASLPKLEDLVFRENPLALKFEGPAYTAEVTKRLPHLKKLDGIPIV